MRRNSDRYNVKIHLLRYRYIQKRRHISSLAPRKATRANETKRERERANVCVSERENDTHMAAIK